MKKELLLLVFLSVMPLYGQQENISFSMDVPESVVAGNTFEVTLRLNKGELKDYSRFSQELPSGFTAYNISSPNADFTFMDQRVRIIWLKLPEEQEIEVKYAIEVHERISGKLELSGTFAYVSNGERAYLVLPDPEVVGILPNPDIDPGLVVDVSEFNQIKTPANIVEPEEEATLEQDFSRIIRQKPQIDPKGVVTINILVNRPENTDFLKIEESIPGGYTFESVENNGGVVSQTSSLARFVWLQPPSENVFSIRYRLVPIPGRSREPLVINGEFSYMEDGKTEVVRVREMDFPLAEMNMSQKIEFMRTGSFDENLALLRPAEVKPEVKALPSSVRSPSQSGKYVISSKRKIIEIDNLKPETGIRFRVQVAAVRKPYFPRVVFSYYDLLREVKVEDIDGWSKYTVGYFMSYEDANAMKNRIVTETPVESAFIVAYKDGRRVPVRDVL
jgi:hypothetical protein